MGPIFKTIVIKNPHIPHILKSKLKFENSKLFNWCLATVVAMATNVM